MASFISIRNKPNEFLTPFFNEKKYSSIAVLTDSNTHKLCYPIVESTLPSHSIIVIEAGEEHKNLDTCRIVWEKLTEHKLDRHSLLVIIGGGVIGDLGGFCAATYKRGIDFVLMPTTLLAQVDASVGGKLGIDFLHFKNHIGVFCEPVATLISPAFLKTLPHRELRSGFAEVIKHSIISDKQMWNTISKKKLEEQDWDELIPHSVSFKKSVVESDPKERGLRKILNFGHTIGHAVESYFLETENRLFHGEAIAIGMITEAFIAKRKNLISKDELAQIESYLLEIYPKSPLPASDKIIALMLQDKKNKGNKILMALPDGIGKAKWDIEVNEEEIVDALNYYVSL
jgi:3-dehydroquinate synthase